MMAASAGRVAPASPLERAAAAAAASEAPFDIYESDEFAKHQISVPEKRGWKKLAALFGPGFLVCIAYVDPANFQNDLQAGADYKMQLLWIILVATISGLLIQSLAARLGVVTRKHLAEHCRLEYSRKTTILLWLLAEVTIIASDIPEVIGTAFALNILFKLPIWAGVLLTGLSTLLLLALQQYGVRKLEFVIAFFVLIMAVCFFVEMGYVKPDAKQVLRGMFVPTLKGDGATGLAISLLGAMIMPHNLFLHSALVLTRRIPFNTKAIKDCCWFYTFETGFTLLMAFMINVAVISVSATVCNGMQLSAENQAKCEDLDLNEASFLLKNVLGKWSRIVFGIAIFASGQSSTITGTYAGQYVMQGFLNLRYKAWVRNLITRSVAIVPSLAVALLGGSSGAGKLIAVCSMILAFQLPFTLVPLIKFTSSKTKMGRHVSHKAFTIITWLIGCGVLGINVYFVISSFIKWILHGTLMKGGRIVIGILGFCPIAMYLSAVAYLAIRSEKQKTFNPPIEDEEETKFHEDLSRSDSEPHISLPREDIKQLRLPHEIIP